METQSVQPMHQRRFEQVTTRLQANTYEGCQESIQPFSISREPISWPWCNLAASQRRPYCTSVKSHSPEGASQSAVRRLWMSLCTVWPSHSQWPSEQISFIKTMCLPILKLSCRLVLAKHHITRVCQHPLKPRCGSQRFPAFPKAKVPVEMEEICECDGHTVHKLSQRRLTADWLAPRECDCSRMRSKVSSDWLPSYIKVTRPFLEIFKMAGYSTDIPRMSSQKLRNL